jgi:hypothetical protein
MGRQDLTAYVQFQALVITEINFRFPQDGSISSPGEEISTFQERPCIIELVSSS